MAVRAIVVLCLGALIMASPRESVPAEPAGRITGEKQFIIIGSQALHARYPDLADEIVRSAEVDVLAALAHIAAGVYQLIALPLHLSGADGAPVRAVLCER